MTVAPRGQKDLEIVLLKLAPSPMLDEATCEVMRGLLEKGAFGAGVLETDDCRQTYDELSSRGVELKGPPAERPYGIEAVMRDPFGNWWSVVQRR